MTFHVLALSGGGNREINFWQDKAMDARFAVSVTAFIQAGVRNLMMLTHLIRCGT